MKPIINEPTPEDSNSRLRRIIRKLPLRLDVKNKIIKYVFGEEKQGELNDANNILKDK